jgi:hypothetical protein
LLVEFVIKLLKLLNFVKQQAAEARHQAPFLRERQETEARHQAALLQKREAVDARFPAAHLQDSENEESRHQGTLRPKLVSTQTD